LVRDDVNFDIGFHSVHNYLVRYLFETGVAGVRKDMKIHHDNVTTFLRKYVKASFIDAGWLKVIQNKPCLNLMGWAEMMKLARVIIEDNAVRLRKK
jgi:hypothetical protein